MASGEAVVEIFVFGEGVGTGASSWPPLFASCTLHKSGAEHVAGDQDHQAFGEEEGHDVVLEVCEVVHEVVLQDHEVLARLTVVQDTSVSWDPSYVEWEAGSVKGTDEAEAVVLVEVARSGCLVASMLGHAVQVRLALALRDA